MRRAGWVLLSSALLFVLADVLFPLPPKPTYAPCVLARDSTVLYAFLTPDEQWRMEARLDEITPELTKAIIYKEDKYFWYHPGINPVAVFRAFGKNILFARRTSGASTITMQVARMLEPKQRSYGNKLVEMFRALQLEVHYSKREILQTYLSLVPYGSNIQGVKAAALLYFNKTPDQLSLAEITALSIIPNRPNRLVMGRDNAHIIRERNKWLQRFERDHLFSDDIIQDALREPLSAYRHSAPSNAPQFAWRMRRMQPGALELYTTIDAHKQQTAEELTAAYMEGLKLQGVYNAAVLVVDIRTREVQAYVGSSDFFDSLHHGQVDGVTAHRSPGSTLKPLLYGMALDRGLITPKTMIADVPMQFGTYAPENYDLHFRGNIPAAEALQQSLNIPAVTLLNQLGVPHFVNALSQAGFRQVWKDRKKMGLSVILGGCGVSLEELTGLYSAFANKGQFQPLCYQRSNKTGAVARDTTLVSIEGNYLLTEILRNLHRPDVPNLSGQALRLPQIAWKTGTSYGRRDAWSIGFNQHYTIGVWIGNFNGKGVAGLNGAGTATPLLFQLFRALDPLADQAWDMPMGQLAQRFVCPESGLPVGEHCTQELSDYYLPGISKNELCHHLREYWLSANEQMVYCTTCLPETGYKTRLLPDITPELTAYYEQYHIAYQRVPPHNPACQRLFDGRAPQITSLADNASYIIADRGKQQLQLSCTAGNDVQTVYWYVNNRFLCSSPVTRPVFFAPESPDLHISCTDDKGRVAAVRVKVRFL